MTNAAVLVLNRHYQPIHVRNVKRAFTLLYLGVARVVDPEFKTFDFESWAQLSSEVSSDVSSDLSSGAGARATSGDDFIKTVNRAIRIPRVIVLQLYDRI